MGASQDWKSPPKYRAHMPTRTITSTAERTPATPAVHMQVVESRLQCSGVLGHLVVLGSAEKHGTTYRTQGPQLHHRVGLSPNSNPLPITGAPESTHLSEASSQCEFRVLPHSRGFGGLLVIRWLVPRLISSQRKTTAGYGIATTGLGRMHLIRCPPGCARSPLALGHAQASFVVATSFVCLFVCLFVYS